jgi:hypothetical protein
MEPTLPLDAPLPDKYRRRPLRRILRNWLQRHRNRFNFWIHMIGIPLAVAGVVLMCWKDVGWEWGIGAFVLGYVLQWIGHLAEGNDVGEWAGIKRMLGLPYVSIAPQYANAPSEAKK